MSLQPKSNIGIFSHHEDLHAFAVAEWLQSNCNANAFVFETDNLFENSEIAWFGDSNASTVLSDHSGEQVDIHSLDAVWWRRYRQGQIAGSKPKADAGFSSPQWQATLLGVALCDFQGPVINSPESQIRAENKMYQLRAAAQVGLNVPRTCVTQSPATLEAFRDAVQPNEIIAKLMTPPRSVPTKTVLLEEWPVSDHLITGAPTIYQECIRGTTHLRVHCFGERVVCCEIETEHLDWRVTLEGRFTEIELDEELSQKLLQLNQKLGIDFAIHDLKISPEKQTYYLETNHQGQFLFIEGLGGGRLIEAFCLFIAGKADEHRQARSMT